MTVEVACATGLDYAPHAAAMLHSLLTRTPEAEIRAHYLVGPEFPAAHRRRLCSMVGELGGRLSFHEIPERDMTGLTARGHIARTMWYPTFLPRLVADLDRVLYIDADAIVMDTVAPLWETDLGANYLGAVTNVFMPHHVQERARRGLSGPEGYFNSGVLLLNLAAMRADDCTGALLDHARREGERLMWGDQDALNDVLGHRRLELAPRWNAMNAIVHFPWAADVFDAEELREARQRPAIRHFEGPGANKPWHFEAPADMRALYRRHRRATPWPRYRPEGVTAGAVLRRAGIARTRS